MSPCRISAETPPGFNASRQPCSTHHPWGLLLEYLHQFVYLCLRNKGHVECAGVGYWSWVSVVGVPHNFLSGLYLRQTCPMPTKDAKCACFLFAASISWVQGTNSHTGTVMAHCHAKPGHSSHCQDRIRKDSWLPAPRFSSSGAQAKKFSLGTNYTCAGTHSRTGNSNSG
jgi:hypothetical protein